MQQIRLYERVSGKIEEALRVGALRPGDRLPSVRGLSERERVSVSTVLQAYLTLEARGLIEARPQSGHYVRRQRALPPEPPATRPSAGATPVTVSALVAKVVESARDPDLVPLGCNQPDPELFPWGKLGRIAAGIAREGGGFTYELPPGARSLRRQLARRSLEWGCALSPDDFIVTSGAMEAVQLSLLAVARRGDAIAIESPAFFGSLQLIEALGLRAVEIPSCPREGMDLDALARVLKTRRIAAVLAVTNFSNPLGCVMPDENKERLVTLLAGRGVPLIEDDLYGDVYFGSSRPRAAKSFDQRGLVLHCGSFSKTLAPGWRVGWVAAGKFRERVSLLKFAQTIATASLQQLAMAEFLAAGHYERHLRSLRKSVAATMRSLGDCVAAHFPAGTRATRPDGGGVLWVEMPEEISSLELHDRALAAGIAIAPGPIFSARQGYENCLRLSCGVAWSPRVEAAIATLGRTAAELAGGPVRAPRRLAGGT
ncbi:MAG: PLP-dependent aminotransferase family protein [Deltaproteobacteria bacterium]|nr:MAG: PLP-dependent aminotransferase family protein [Deltaproteobacteria bacterium]